MQLQAEQVEAPAPKLETVQEVDDNEPVDETGLDPEEITTVMTQANVSRSKAAKALRKHSNLVDAILVRCKFVLLLVFCVLLAHLSS